MLTARSPARETLRRGAHSRRQIKDGNGAVIRLGAPAPIVKRILSRIPYRLRLSARFGSPLAVVRVISPPSGGLRAALDTLEPLPSTAVLSAQEAKDRLREIVEGFFFRRLTAGDGKRVGRACAAPLLELSLLQVDGRGLSSIAAFALEANPLTFVQIADTRALDRGYMNEHVLQAVFRLNEAVTPPGIEPLNGSDSHCFPSQNGIATARKRAGGRTSARCGKQVRRSITRLGEQAEPQGS